MNKNERNAVLAECAELIDKQASEWNTAFFDFLEKDFTDGADYAMTKAMTLQDAADEIRMLNPEFKAKRNEERIRAEAMIKRIRSST